METFIFILFYVGSNALVALLGRNRQIGYWWSFAICSCCTWFIGLPVVLLSKKNDVVFLDFNKSNYSNGLTLRVFGVILIIFGIYTSFVAIAISKNLPLLGFGPLVLGSYLIRLANINDALKKNQIEWENNLSNKQGESDPQ